jgi:hypothetical protein
VFLHKVWLQTCAKEVLVNPQSGRLQQFSLAASNNQQLTSAPVPSWPGANRPQLTCECAPGGFQLWPSTQTPTGSREALCVANGVRSDELVFLRVEAPPEGTGGCQVSHG